MPKHFIANKNDPFGSLRSWIRMQQLEIPFADWLGPFGGRVGGRVGTLPFAGASRLGRVPCGADADVTVQDALAIATYRATTWPQAGPEGTTQGAWGWSAGTETHLGSITPEAPAR